MKASPKNLLLHIKKILTCFLFILFCNDLISQNIYNFAGTGTMGYSGDGGPANVAGVGNPYGVCADNSGNIYISHDGHVIRKVNSLGIITTIAGPGTYTISGDGGPATSAYFSHAEGITIDGSGNIYIADNGNHSIRKINTSGIITTIAGTGTAGFSGDGGPAVSAQISWPHDVITDLSGNIYFTEESSHRIRKIDPSGILTTVVGNGTAGFSGDGGPANIALIKMPMGMATDGFGNIYFCDYGNSKIRKINTSGIISTISATQARDISSDVSGNIYFTAGGNTIGKINTVGMVSTVAGNGTSGYSGDGGLATSAQIALAYCVAVDASNNIYFGQQGPGPYNQCVRIVCQNNCLAGINENSKANAVIKIYPNPVSNNLFISSEYSKDGTEIEIINTFGQTVMRLKYRNEIDVSDIPPGSYFLKLYYDQNQSLHSKFIKQ
jgi:hypothetical protein